MPIIHHASDADLTAIGALTGTTGLLKKTAADTWILDTTAYSTLTAGNTPAVDNAATSSAGTATTAARSDHVHALQTTISGNAGSATVLQTPRKINGTEFDGSKDITINAVDSTARIAVAEKGAANGVAPLGADAKVAVTHLPTYTATQVGADPAGTASGLMNTHTTDANPHPVYLTQTEASNLYQPLAGGISAQSVALTATQASTATALANVTALVLPVQANSLYFIECEVTFFSASTLAGINLGISTPTGSRNMVEILVPITSTAAATQLRTTFPSGAVATNLGNVLGTGVTATNSAHTARISGQILIGATAGNCQITFATETAGSAITLQIGSRLTLLKVM